jgi:poly-gamma-glutamate capsule biosynthesis protein CapA/YwtB (metallophosphatase superfamily)
MLPRGMLLVSLFVLLGAGAARGAGRGVVIEDFEAGQVALQGYPGQDQDPGGWHLTGQDTYDGSAWSLALTGNTWKIETVSPVALADSSVWQVAVRCDDLAEMHGFGVGDGQHELFYTFWGQDLPADENWWTVYQGAFDRDGWRLFLLPLGRDWFATFGTLPVIDRVIFVNDGDSGGAGITLFDAIADVTDDQPRAPGCRILYTIANSRKVDRDLFEIDVQFHGKAFDPEGGALAFHWDFGDSSGSEVSDPQHQFLVHADHPYTVSLAVIDPDGLAAGDTCQIQVQSGPAAGPLTVNFAGDIMTGRGFESNGGIIDTQGVEALFRPTLPILGEAADLSVANLEICYTTRGTRHPTKSVVFRSRPENLEGIRFAGIDVVTIGNNHIIDYGEIGMLDTIEGLEERGIPYSGAGTNEYFALLPCFKTERGVRLAFLGQCSRTGRQWNYQPFLDAGYDKPGFAYLLPHNLETALAGTRDLADIVILQTHSGDEYDPVPPDDGRAWTAPPPVEANEVVPGQPEFRFRNEPTPGERFLRRQALDLGADVLINHHPHVLQGFESYGGKLIAHSLGNFVFDLWYPETMPTMVLTLEVAKDGIVGYTFTPAWIDDWIPQPVRGDLSREIIDRLADYSRPMNALVVPDYAAGRARIHLTRAEVDSQRVVTPLATALVANNGGAISPPLRLPGDGSLSAVGPVTGDGAGWEVRWGREILWHGGFEDEGATLWDVNSSDEWLDQVQAHRGLRSLALKRAHNQGTAVGTDLERHLPCDPAHAHSAAGWVRSANAGDARLAARFYENRSTETALASIDLHDAIVGDTGWTEVWRDLATPATGLYFELRASLAAPAAGTGQAWFDDLAFVEWEPWQPAGGPLPVPSPGNFRYVQVRSATEATQAVCEVAETVYGSVLTPVTGEAPAAASVVVRNHPNPFNPRTTLVLDLPAGTGAVPVVLEVYDARGRRVATVYRGHLEAGRTHGFTWDGRDDDGRALASGTYLARVRAGEQASTHKMLLLR